MAKKTGSTRKKVVNVEPTGQAHVHASFNNIIVSHIFGFVKWNFYDPIVV